MDAVANHFALPLMKVFHSSAHDSHQSLQLSEYQLHFTQKLPQCADGLPCVAHCRSVFLVLVLNAKLHPSGLWQREFDDFSRFGK